MPSIPRGHGAHPGLRDLLSRRPATPHPRGDDVPILRSNTPPDGVPLDEASMRVQAIHPSGLPLACGNPDGTGALGLSPELRTPPTRSRTTHVGAGTGHRARTWNNALRHRPSLQSCVFTRCVRLRVPQPGAAVSMRNRGGLTFATASRERKYEPRPRRSAAARIECPVDQRPRTAQPLRIPLSRGLVATRDLLKASRP